MASYPSPEYDRRQLSVTRVPVREFHSLHQALLDMRAMALELYAESPNNNPNHKLIPDIPTPTSLSVLFLLANYPGLQSLYKTETTISNSFAEKFSQVTAHPGFMCIESGPIQEGEAGYMINWSGWPKEATYVGQFTVNPLLPTEAKVSIQTQLWAELFSLAEQGKVPPNCYLITIEQVAAFAAKSNLNLLPVEDASLNTQSDLVVALSNRYPKYWKKNPRLYQVTRNYDK